MQRCTRCDKVCERHELKCPKCGGDTLDLSVDERICRHCNHRCAPDAEFCPKCGGRRWFSSGELRRDHGQARGAIMVILGVVVGGIVIEQIFKQYSSFVFLALIIGGVIWRYSRERN